MRTTFLFISLFISTAFLAQSAKDTLRFYGVYQNQNVFLRDGVSINAFYQDGNKYFVNGQQIADSLLSDQCLRLTQMNFNFGDSVHIVYVERGAAFLSYKYPKSIKGGTGLIPDTVYFSGANADSIHIRISANEKFDSLIFSQHRWDRWYPLELVRTAKKPVYEFSFPVRELINGLNVFRFTITDGKGNHRHFEIIHPQRGTRATFWPVRASHDIRFSRPTHYMILDPYGNMKQKGFGSSIDVSGFPKGTYFLHYDNVMGEFHKE